MRPPRRFRIERLGRVSSTQTLLRQRLEAGERVDGLVLRALEQTGGRGRFERRWYSPPGGSYQSLALADPTGSLRDPRVGVAVAAGIAHVLAEFDFEVAVKWPNDLYLRAAVRQAPPTTDGNAGQLLTGKLGGVLCEHVRRHLLVGVGINVTNDVPPGAARLDAEDPEEVSDAVLAGVEFGLELIRKPELLSREFARFDLLAGRHVEVEEPGQRLLGVAAGIDNQGRLLLNTAGGTVATAGGHVRRVDDRSP